jgi:hypothetical protein
MGITEKSHSDPERTTPLGMFRYALEFFAAGCSVDDDIGVREDYSTAPANYLIGHSIELVLKAYLLQHGVSLKEIRERPLSHSLTGCFKAAEERGFQQHFQLAMSECELLHKLDALYSDKQFEYIETGRQPVLMWGELTQLGNRLLLAVAPTIEHAQSFIDRMPAAKKLRTCL